MTLLSTDRLNCAAQVSAWRIYSGQIERRIGSPQDFDRLQRNFQSVKQARLFTVDREGLHSLAQPHKYVHHGKCQILSPMYYGLPPDVVVTPLPKDLYQELGSACRGPVYLRGDPRYAVTDTLLLRFDPVPQFLGLLYYLQRQCNYHSQGCGLSPRCGGC